MKRSSRVIAGVMGLVLVLLAEMRADETAKSVEQVKPAWQRRLSGAQAWKVSLLDLEVNSLIGLGKFASALKPATEIYNIRRRVQGDDHWETVNAKWKVEVCEVMRGKKPQESVELAWALRTHAFATAIPALNHKQLFEGEKSLIKALTICKNALGEKHLYVSYICSNLQQNLFEQGRYVDGLRYAREGLAIRRNVLGEAHPETAQSYCNVAFNLNALDKYHEAEQYFHKSLSIDRKVLGEENTATATSYQGVAKNLYDQGKYQKAMEFCRRSLSIYQKALGDDHQYTAECYESIATIYTVEGKYQKADEIFRKMLAIRIRKQGEEHPDTASSYHKVGFVQHCQGKYQEAEKYYQKALAVSRKVLGEEHPKTAECYDSVATNLESQGRYQEAEEGYRKALAIRRNVLGEEHSFLTRSYNNLATNLRLQRKYLEAGECHQKALAICRNLLGEESLDTALSYNAVAEYYFAQGKYQKAEEGFHKSLSILHKVLREETPYLPVTLISEAISQQFQGKYRVAEDGFRKALAICRKVLEEEDPTTTLCYYRLAQNLRTQGNYHEAESLLLCAADSFTNARLLVAAAGLERAAFTSRHSPLPELAAMLARNDKADHAWQRFEASLARGTWDDLTARLRRPQAERDKQAQITARIDQLNKLIEKASTAKPIPEQSKQRDQLLIQLRQAYDELAAFTQELEKKYGPIAGQVLPRAQIQKYLSPDAAFVAWLDIAGQPKAADPNGEHWAILLRSSGDPIWVWLHGSGDKNAWTDADTKLPSLLREALQSPRGIWQPLAERLRKQRLDPLAPHLEGIRRLIVLPSTALAGVPVEVIADGYTVSYAHSGTMFAHLRQEPALTNKGLFVLADPSFDSPKEKEKPQPLPPGGVLITMVMPGSNAAKSKLKPNDVLLRYGDTDLSKPGDFKPLPESSDADERVSVIVWRDGRTSKRQVRPGKLGVAIANEPAPQALAEQRRMDHWLASRSGGDDGNWPRLPGTLIEAISLHRLFDKDAPVQMLLASDASEQRLNELAKSGELGKYRYIHLATHGEANDAFPLRSAVILARDHLPDDKQRTELLVSGQPIPDGRLEADEVLRRWNLHADLVTLSACQTALGKYESGEGFVGFAQALILCGTRSVCLSLWKVDDVATALLMERFYRNLLGKRADRNAPMPKAAALAEAKAWLRTLTRKEAEKLATALTEGDSRGKPTSKRPTLETPPAAATAKPGDCPFAHPHYWAAFILTGDPE